MSDQTKTAAVVHVVAIIGNVVCRINDDIASDVRLGILFEVLESRDDGGGTR